jgi:phosphoglycerate dehydrogenase-like enzyme
MKVYYYDGLRYPEEVEKAYEASYLPLDRLLALSDYVVLSLPHTPESEGLIGVEQLAQMKSSATLINVARGGLVDEDALAEALQSRRIAMAGLDVYRMEPLPESRPLRKLDNGGLLPHLGGGSNRCWDIDIPACLENIYRFFKGDPDRGVINRRKPN